MTISIAVSSFRPVVDHINLLVCVTVTVIIE
ncbi:hypothetical protein TELCIR_12603 [Teladorsagia circumcincta]|uniref:Uncharacterized protein n=1 Tax=Teladorsagia circumcincta TaxID=45464 RepID=A0A2G9U614_TELCI|nr:hypothetical protein TELCIR_12603 [Teladorsagia circumcincta]